MPDFPRKLIVLWKNFWLGSVAKMKAGQFQLKGTIRNIFHLEFSLIVGDGSGNDFPSYCFHCNGGRN